MTTKQQILFDQSLPLLVEVIRGNLGDAEAQRGIVLRDTTGRLCFVVAREAASEDERAQVTQALADALGAYARQERPIAFAGDPGTETLQNDPSLFPVRINELGCQLIDRRIVGAAWLNAPVEVAVAPPRVVFASVKGGVGRSSALAVAAADLARRNKNVLVVDLDLEAPGVGDLLLDDERMPRLGVLDFLVENGIGSVPDSLLEDFIGASALTTGSSGRVDVVPALGRLAYSSSENVLPKLARAMIEDIEEDGRVVSVSEQISTMIDRLARRTDYDVVLIDSRAGLAELTAPSLLSLSASILLFGTAQLQTLKGYRALFAGLRMLANRDRALGRSADWRLKLKAVYAKASMNEDVLARHRDSLYELFAEELYDEDQARLTDINFNIDDASAPHFPLIIPFNQGLIDFDPLRDPSQLTWAFYEQTFRPFLNGIDVIISESDASRERGGGA